jgi:hypothetical protein
MKINIFLVTFFFIFTISCQPTKNKIVIDGQVFDNENISLNDKNGRGEQTFEYINNLSIMEIYNVIRNNFFDYNVELFYLPESSSFQKEDRIYIINRQMFNLNSEKYRIYILQYSIDSDETNGIIYISYSLKGENIYERIDELIEPMEKVKQCLFNNFPKNLNVNNFSEKFTPLPMR